MHGADEVWVAGVEETAIARGDSASAVYAIALFLRHTTTMAAYYQQRNRGKCDHAIPVHPANFKVWGDKSTYFHP